MHVFLEASLIFALRVLGIATSTISTLMIVQGRKFYAMLSGFISALVYVIAIGKVVANLSNVWNILAYCTGFAVGTLAGMIWEQRMAAGFAEVRFISTEKGGALAQALRQGGFGVTELYGRGRERTVDIVESPDSAYFPAAAALASTAGRACKAACNSPLSLRRASSACTRLSYLPTV